MKEVVFRIFFIFLLLPFFLILSIPVYGQGYRTFKAEIEKIKKEARWRIGPFRIYPSIQFKNMGYDDNVYYQREEESPVSDYTATVSPEIKVSLLFRNYLIISLKENPEYVYYFRQKRERRLNNILSPSFKFLFLHRFVISGQYSNKNRRRRATSEFDVRANELIQEYSGSIFYETARGTSFGVFAASRDISFQDIDFPGQEIYLSRILNRQENQAGFKFYYRLLSQSFLFLKGDYTEYIFEHKDVGLRDSYSSGLNAGIEFPTVGNITGQFSLGYKELHPRLSDKKGFKGLVGDIEIKFRVWRFMFNLNYERDCRFSFSTNNIFFIEERYGSGVFFYITKFLRVDYNLNRGVARYPEPFLFQMLDGSYKEVERKDNYRIHTMRVVIRIMRNIGIGMGVNYWERESNYFGAGKDRTFFSVYVTHDF